MLFFQPSLAIRAEPARSELTDLIDSSSADECHAVGFSVSLLIGDPGLVWLGVRLLDYLCILGVRGRDGEKGGGVALGAMYVLASAWSWF